MRGHSRVLGLDAENRVEHFDIGFGDVTDPVDDPTDNRLAESREGIAGMTLANPVNQKYAEVRQ